LEKRTKNLLFLETPFSARRQIQNTKVFCFFSSEKKTLLAFSIRRG